MFFFSLKVMKESGQIDRLWNRWKDSPAVGCLGDGAEALEPKTLLADFIILGMAAAISVIVLLAELLVTSSLIKRV